MSATPSSLRVERAQEQANFHAEQRRTRPRRAAQLRRIAHIARTAPEHPRRFHWTHATFLAHATNRASARPTIVVPTTTRTPSVCGVASPTSYARMCTHLCLCSPASLALALHDVASTMVGSRRRRTTCDLEGSRNVVSSSSHVLVACSDVGWRSPSVQATCTCAWRRRTCSA